jgi:LuxR family maltose regulon positive regulatory protein
MYIYQPKLPQRGGTLMKNLKSLKRDRVNRALESIFYYPLTIVEAPMGYGKTTAVREFLALKGIPVIWTSFLSKDDTASWFWERLAAEIGKFDKVAEISLRKLGVPADMLQTAEIISILNEMNYKPNTVLVVDDFHLTKSMKITALFRRFVMEMPDDFHIIILTRDTTNLNITELTVKGLCNVITQSTLRFTDSEIRDYCSLMGFTAGEDETRRIGDYTGGWISLIYLIMLGLERGIPVDRTGAINELVEKVLYNAYDERIQRFLLRLSVMDIFTAEKAAYITQEEESEEILKRLRRENAFITFDEAAGVYIIHNVLLDFLRGK